MKNEFGDSKKDGQRQKDLSHRSKKGEKLSGGNGTLKSRNSFSRQNPQHTLVSNGKRLQIVKNDSKCLFFHGTKFLENKIPRHVVSLDEKHLRRCLELIHISATKSARCDISVNLVGSLEMVNSSCHLDLPKMPMENTCDPAQFVFQFALESGRGSDVIGSTITSYKSIIDMLDRPLLQKFGALDFDSNIIKSRLSDTKASISCNSMSSLDGLSDDSPWKKQEKEAMCLGDQNHGYGPEKVRKRIFSVSSTNSTCSSSGPSSYSVSALFSQGTLQCIWKYGVPHFVFSLNDKKEVYLAEMSQAESVFDNEALDYLYLIHLRKGSDSESHLVGKMKVSTTFSLCQNNSKMLEREFVLFAAGGNSQIPCHDVKKNKGLTKKVVDVFRNSRSSRQRSISRFSKPSSTLDLCSWEQSQETSNDLEATNLSENDFLPNLESVAIVLKENLTDNQQQEVGGWGMKFLKKASLNHKLDTFSEESEPWTSMDIIIPKGLHGGPRTRNGGPSSLTERWKSGGICDCGGWDLGCPLTILKCQPGKEEGSQHKYGEGQCKLFEFFIEGSENVAPGLRIVNVDDGLYFVQFQSILLALQSFSVALAYIHSQIPGASA